ncbi:MAG: hypothetical protein ACI8VJ_000563 [Polaribacter sp.]|jgi:hypothetical protein
MFKKIILHLFLVIFSSLFFFCKTNIVLKKEEIKNEEITFQEKQTVDEKYNQDKSKLLILSSISNKNPVITFNYRVIDTQTKKELKKGVFIGQSISWLDKTTLKCMPYVGMIQKEDDLILDGEKKNTPTYITIKIN